jgi:hypothetical protein
MDPEALVSGGQKMLDRRQRRRLDQIDHDRGGQDRHLPAPDAGRRMLGSDQKTRGPLQPGRHLGEVDHRRGPLVMDFEPKNLQEPSNNSFAGAGWV